MRIFTSIILLICFEVVHVRAQVLFKRTYGFGLINEGRDVIQTNDLGFAVTGSTTPGWGGQTNFYLLKTDSLGNTEFQYSYGGTGIDQGFALQQLPDSGFLLAGYSNSFSVNNDYDALVIRTDKNGNQLWSKSFGTPDWDFMYDLKPTIDGNFILAGNSYGSGNGSCAGYLVKINGNGDVLWQKFIQQIELVNLRRIVTKSDGRFVVCGNTSPSSSYFNDGFVAVIDSAGDTTRTFRIDNGKHESVNSISFFSNGDLAIVGVSEDSLHSDNDDQFIMRMDTNGVTAWYRLFTDTVGQELFNDVYVHLDTMIAVGSRNGNGAGAYDFHVVKFKPDGYYYSAHTFGAADDEKCNRIISTTGTGYALVGITTSFGPGSQSILLIRTDSMFNSAANFVIDVEKIETKKNISVYPNPSTGKIHIAINKKIPGLTINIYDISGNLIYSKGDNEINSALDIKLKSGIYLAEFSANNTIEIKKIIIQE